MEAFTECDEVADNMAGALARQGTMIPRTFDEALRIVKRRMPDESSQIQDNVAESLLRWSQPR